MVAEQPCATRKRFSPYRCEFVPDVDLLAVCLQWPKLCELVFVEDFKKWLMESHAIVYEGRSCRAHDENRKRYWNSVASLKLQEMVQRRLNFAVTTFKTGHILHRAGKVYRRHVGLRWKVYGKVIEFYYEK